MKRCTKCGEFKPLEAFPPAKRMRDGRDSSCRSCRYAYHKEWYRRNHDKALEYAHAYYRNNKERQSALKADWRKRHIEELRAYELNRREKKTRYHANRKLTDPNYTERRNRNAALWRANNPEKVAAYQLKAKTDPSLKCRKAAYSRRYKLAHLEEIRAKQREYRKAHPEKVRERAAVRRARKRNAPVVEKIDRLAIAERDNWTCHICGKKIKRQDLTLDHLVPLSKGGAHAAFNLAAAHSKCNNRRGPGWIPAQLKFFEVLELPPDN